jgi:hypothetical protein
LAFRRIGISQDLGGWDIYDNKAPALEWNADRNDARSNITADEMLRMSSGTCWTPSALNVDPTGNVLATVECIFGCKGDCAGYAANLP